MRKFILIAGVISILVVVFFVFGWYATDHFTGSFKSEQRFDVRPNENAYALGIRLEESGLVFSRFTFLWYLVHGGKTHQIIAGQYMLSGSLTVPEIALLVTTGKTVSRDIKVTFPEGFTMTQMADRLTVNKLPGKEFLALTTQPLPAWRTQFDFLASLPEKATLEGYLFPDTYFFAPEATAQDIVTVLLKNFGQKSGALFGYSENGNNGAVDPKLIHGLVTMASIIEEEGRTKEERGMISDIFRKRIAIGQPLQSDATVNYIHGTTRLQPTLKDTESDSLYNTYRVKGLPPGPISNPGLVSLQAALSPTNNPYYYFLVDPKTKETIYSATFEAHVRNRSLHGL